MKFGDPNPLQIEVRPRPWFRPFLLRKERWACMVCSRRGGKTFAVLQDLMVRMLTKGRHVPPRKYAYLGPTYPQVKDIAWQYIHSFFADVPGAWFNESELKVSLRDGTSLRLYSAESYQRLRGLYLDGIVIDEYAECPPNAWESVIRATLSDYNGFATFIGTPAGRNHFYDLLTAGEKDPEWFTLRLPASKINHIPEKELASIQRSLQPNIYAQEFEVSFDVGRPGAIFTAALAQAREDGRVGKDILWRKELPVHCAFDVGAPRNQRCVIFQVAQDRVIFLEGLEGDENCQTPADWTKRLQAKRYMWGKVCLPHDAMMANGGLWDAGFRAAGMGDVVAVPRSISVWDRVQTLQDLIPRCQFALPGCDGLLESLENYHSKVESDGQTVKDIPVHDWSSHYADSATYAAQAAVLGLTTTVFKDLSKPRLSVTDEPNFKPRRAKR